MIKQFVSILSTKIILQQNIQKHLVNKNISSFLFGSRHLCARDYQRSIFDRSNHNGKFSEPQSVFDTDDYIISYPIEYEKKKSIIGKEEMHKMLNEILCMTNADIDKIGLKAMKFKRHNTPKDVEKCLTLLSKSKISLKNIIANPWLITMSSSLLEIKLDSIQSAPYRDINDFTTFLKLAAPRLNKLMLFLKQDAKLIPSAENRLYYISDKLNLEPHVIAKYLTKRLFVLQMPFASLQVNLNHMLQYGVEPLSIMKDLWAFRYTPKLVQSRLERAKTAKKDKIMPWMVRCPERILEKSLKLSEDEKKLLGDNNSIVDYISARLGYDVECTRAMMQKHPAVFRVRATKIKEVLDYLIDEAKIEKYEIAQVPRILCHGLDTTRRRYEELLSYGCRPSSLVILCRSRREYEKFVRSWLGEKRYRLEMLKKAQLDTQ